MHALQSRSSKWIIHICSSVEGKERRGETRGCRQNGAMRELRDGNAEPNRGRENSPARRIKGEAGRNSSLSFLRAWKIAASEGRQKQKERGKTAKNNQRDQNTTIFPYFPLQSQHLINWLVIITTCRLFFTPIADSQEGIVPQRRSVRLCISSERIASPRGWVWRTRTFLLVCCTPLKVNVLCWETGWGEKCIIKIMEVMGDWHWPLTPPSGQLIKETSLQSRWRWWCNERGSSFI